MIKKAIGVLLVLCLFSLPAMATEVTFNVNMSFAKTLYNFNPDVGDSVVIRASFNGFGGTAYPLHDPEDDDIWSETYDLSPGSIDYKYVIIFADGSSDKWEDGIENRPAVVAEVPVA